MSKISRAQIVRRKCAIAEELTLHMLGPETTLATRLKLRNRLLREIEPVLNRAACGELLFGRKQGWWKNPGGPFAELYAKPRP